MSLRFALFGHPVQHSMSPAIHSAAYRALGLTHRYELEDLVFSSVSHGGSSGQQQLTENVTLHFDSFELTNE